MDAPYRCTLKIFYRTAEAIKRDPVVTVPHDDGLLKEDYEYITDLGDVTLEEAFRQMNVVDGDELPTKLGVRSMMNGDVILDEDGDVWFLGVVGWERCNWW